MLKLVLIGAVAVPAIAAGSVAATGVVVVDVQQRGGPHIVIPVPLALAQAAAGFVPEDKMRLHLDEKAQRLLPVAHDVLAALAEAEDGELVRVEEPGQKVSIRKEGGLVRIRVDDRDEHVNVQVPIALALAALPEPGGRFSASQAVWALQHARLTEVVDVQGRDGDRVNITVY
jgi:hypothetical protein